VNTYASPPGLSNDLEGALVDRSPLADELIEAPIDGSAFAAVVEVDSARVARRISVKANPEPHRLAALRRPMTRLRSRAPKRKERLAPASFERPAFLPPSSPPRAPSD
jgi:hypothetical protein